MKWMLPDDAIESLFRLTGFLFLASFSCWTLGSSGSSLLGMLGSEGACSFAGLELGAGEEETFGSVRVFAGEGAAGAGGGWLLVATTGVVTAFMGSRGGGGCLGGGDTLVEMSGGGDDGGMGCSGSRAGTSRCRVSVTGFSSCPFIPGVAEIPFPTGFISFGKAPLVMSCSDETGGMLFLTATSFRGSPSVLVWGLV